MDKKIVERLRRNADGVPTDSGGHVWLSLSPKTSADAADLIEAQEIEIKRLKQGLWDCAMLAGEDTDGNDTPDRMIYPDIVDFAKEAVSQLRQDYNDGLDDFIECEKIISNNKKYKRSPIGTIHNQKSDLKEYPYA